MAIIAFWILVVTWVAFRRLHPVPLGLASGFVLLATLFWIGKWACPTFAIAQDVKQKVQVFGTPEAKESGVELPSGTVIQLTSEKKATFQKITRPVTGWIALSSIQMP